MMCAEKAHIMDAALVLFSIDSAAEKSAQFVVQPMYRQAHYVVEATTDLLDTYCADPLLYAVGSGFVKRAVALHIVAYLLWGE